MGTNNIQARKINTRIKKDDLVQVITGKDKGSTGKVTVINAARGKIIVSGINMMSKTMKKKSQQDQGGVISIEAPIDISNVQVVVKGNPTRVGYKIKDGKKVRFAKKTGEEL